jgi:hypothetical protein
LGSVVKLALQIGEHSVLSNNIQIRAEIPKDDLIHIVQVASDVTTTLADGTSRTGPLLEIDTISAVSKTAFADFLSIVANRVVAILTENKLMFFNCVNAHIIEKMEPVYG